MSLLTHTQTVFPVILHNAAKPNSAPQAAVAPSSHIAMIKRFAAFVLAFAGIAAVVVAVITIKLSIFYPRFFH